MKKSALPLALLASLGLSGEFTLHTFAEPLPIHFEADTGHWRVSFATVVPGTVSRTVSYTTPGGTASATFSLGYGADGVVTWAKASKASGDETSSIFISLFSDKISGAVVGKNAKGLSIGTVGGASLTSAAFRQFASGIAPKDATPAPAPTPKPTTPTTPTTPKPSTPSTPKATTPTTPKTTTSTPAPTPKPTVPATPTNTEYKRTVKYTSPGGQPEITFALTIDPNGKITQAGAIPVSGDQESARYAVQFINDLKTAVIGKNIKTLTLSSVGGASLTTKAFNKYVSAYVTGKTVDGVTVSVPQKITVSQTLFREVSYNTPGGVSNFRVAVKIDPTGKIQFVNARSVAGSSKDTLSYVKSFGKNIGKNIRGKNIMFLKLSTVGGASLTTKAFIDVITSIRDTTKVTPFLTNKPKTATGVVNPVVGDPITKTISYTTPGGTAQVSFSLIKDTSGVIKSVTASKVAGDATSTAFIDMFVNSISSLVVGKDINTLSLNAVGGASLTTGAFNEFLAGIQTVKPVYTVPESPTISTVTAGDKQVTVSFTPPSSNGGTAITSYAAYASPGGRFTIGSSSPITVTGLTNGVSYTFTVVANNSEGASAASNPSVSVTPTAAVVPTGGTSSNQTLTYTTPGGTAQVSFSMTRDANGVIQTVSATKIAGDSTSSAYIQMFSSAIGGAVIGKNVDSLSLSSVGGASLTTGAFNQFIAPLKTTKVVATAPSAPSSVAATGGNGQATISFLPPNNNGGATITQYTVRSSAGQTAVGTASPIIVTGLTNGTTYTFTVTATNSAGTSSASVPSNSITPSVPVIPPTTGSTTTSTQTVTYTTPGTPAQVTFSITKDSANIIQSVSATKVVGDATSTYYITSFSSAISGLIVGQNINSLTLASIGGASLTTDAFNQFIAPLRTTTTTALTVPGAPLSVSAVAGDASVNVYFNPPISNGGSSITSYKIRNSLGSVLASGTSSPITVNGLTNGTPYTFNVIAVNAQGNSVASANSNTVTPMPATTGGTTTGGTTTGGTTTGGTTTGTQTASQSVTYTVPGRTATANFVLTYNSSNGIIQSASATMVAGNTESASFISRFNSSIGAAVVGTAVNAIPTLSRIGGASLTTPAFNQFAATLKTLTFTTTGGTTTGGTTTGGTTTGGTTTGGTTTGGTTSTGTTGGTTTGGTTTGGTTGGTVTPQTYTMNISSAGNYSSTTATLNAGDSIKFVYTPPYGNEVVTTFSPAGTYSSFTLDRDITSKTITFSTKGTWTIKVKDHSGNTATITVQ